MENRRKVIVAGAGAAGLTAAIFAARQGAEVTLLEAMERPGKKLLLTGNGRCNITNLDQHLSEAYYGNGKEIAASLTKEFGAGSVCCFFEELGLLIQEKNGYVYPYSAQSNSVLEVLLAEVRRLKIKLKLSEKIVRISKNTGSDVSNTQQCGGTGEAPDEAPVSAWTVETATWKYHADAVIMTCGSRCVPSTGSDGSGYELAKALGHKIVPVAPALTPVTCKSEDLQILTGVRCRAKVSLYEGTDKKHLIASETGELQWTKYGVSGIVVFQLSRFVSRHIPKEPLSFSIDLVPEFGEEKLKNLLTGRAQQIKNEKAAILLSGILNEKLIPVVLKSADQILTDQMAVPIKTAKNQTSAKHAQNKKKARSLTKFSCSELGQEQIDGIVQAMKQFELPITGTKSFDTCQVCSGGVDCRELDPVTLESKLHAGLYFAGEIVDVDGPCGGYNLQWAWSSGHAAGCAAASHSAVAG